MASYALLLLSMIATAMSSETLTTTSLNHNPIDDASITGQRRNTITLPLLTHHAMKQRRMLEMGLDEDEMESYLDSFPETPSRPSSRRISLEVGGLYQGYGKGYGTHYVDLWVGTPPQRQTVIVDTGSGVTTFPCSACSDCGQGYHANPSFEEADSSSFRKYKCDSCTERGTCSNRKEDNEHCKIGVAYTEGASWTGYQAEDETYLGGPHNNPLDQKSFEAGPEDASSCSFPLRFACQTRITGGFKTQLADGVMGMYNRKGAFWQQMFDADIVQHQQFSLCFSKEADSNSDSNLAGAVTMGGVDTNLHKSPMVFADGQVAIEVMHGVTLRKVYFMKSVQDDAAKMTQDTTIKFDITTAQLNIGKVILDSGTTDTYFTQIIADTFKSIFKSEVGVDYDIEGMKLTIAQVFNIPSLVVQLNGYSGSTNEMIDISELYSHPRLAGKLDPDHPSDVLVVIPPGHYVQYNVEKEMYYPRIYFTDESVTTFGANFMAGHDVLFDIAENDRIGFAVSDCSYSRLISNKLTDDQNTKCPTSFPKILLTKSPTKSPITATIGTSIPPQGKDKQRSIDIFNRAILITFGVLIVLLVLGLIRMKYVSHINRTRRGQSEILDLMNPDMVDSGSEFERDISKEMEMRDIT